MRKIDFVPPGNPDWDDWFRRCTEAKDKLIESYRNGGDIVINSALYGEMKVNIFMNYDHPFRGKCAYCERDIHNQHGDIDHFRPKGRVVDHPRKIVSQLIAGVEKAHPGYFWMVYDWQNLLPCCIRCNQPTSKFTEGNGIGKWDYFPVNGFRAWEPGEENQEEPLLINPIHVDPTAHIIFNKNGVLGWKTSQGEETIKILGLNEYDLPDRRKERYLLANTLTNDFICSYKVDRYCERTTQLQEQLKKITDGYGEFTTYALIGITDASNSFKEALGEIPC